MKDYFNSRYIISPVCRSYLREGCAGVRGEDECARDSATGHLQSHTEMLWKCSLLQALWGPGSEHNIVLLEQHNLKDNYTNIFKSKCFLFFLMVLFVLKSWLVKTAGCFNYLLHSWSILLQNYLLVGWWTQFSLNCPLATKQLTDCFVITSFSLASWILGLEVSSCSMS